MKTHHLVNMDKRKLIQHGAASLTVSLPSKWLKERGLQKGDIINIENEHNRLVISTEKTTQLKKISEDISKLDRTSLLLYIQCLYRIGYSQIELKFNSPKLVHHRTGKEVSIIETINFIVGRCIGFEMIEQNNNNVMIKYITKEGFEDFKVILRRIFLLILDVSKFLIDTTSNSDYDSMKLIEQKHDTINKFINYCLRTLNKFGYENVTKTRLYYHVIASLDKVVDVIKYTGRDIQKNKKKVSKNTLEIWNDIHNSIGHYYELFYNFSFDKVNHIGEERDRIKSNIKKNKDNMSSDELMYTTSMKEILELILDLVEFRSGLEY